MLKDVIFTWPKAVYGTLYMIEATCEEDSEGNPMIHFINRSKFQITPFTFHIQSVHIYFEDLLPAYPTISVMLHYDGFDGVSRQIRFDGEGGSRFQKHVRVSFSNFSVGVIIAELLGNPKNCKSLRFSITLMRLPDSS